MAKLRPFSCVRPRENLAERIAALPYDVVNREEATMIVKENSYSFLKIDRAETQLDPSVDMYDDAVYEKAKDTLEKMIEDGSFVTEESACYYLYELTMQGRSQTGIVGCASVDDYVSGVIKKHENTRPEKEEDRIRHVETCEAQTGPIFLAYRENDKITSIQNEKKKEKPLYAFVSDDGIRHRVWRIWEEDLIRRISAIFQGISDIYIADGHHRAASAVRVGIRRRAAHPCYTGEEEFNYVLSVLFSDRELMILDYNRVVGDLNGYTEQEFLQSLEQEFFVEKAGDVPYKPERKGRIGMYLNHRWYRLQKKERGEPQTPVEALDVTVLQESVLSPILKIQDPKTDPRIQFVGGIRGLGELERLVDKNGGVAFSMYPTSMEELFAVADAGLLMPPKSTWFEPKLRSGLFIHRF